MKLFLGAIAAAMLLGAGCAHNREASQQSSQASASIQRAEPALSCEVVGTGGSGKQGAVSSQALPVPNVPAPAIPDVPATEAPDASATVPLPQDDANAGAISGGAVEPQDEAIGGVMEPLPQDEAIGGAADQGGDETGGAVASPPAPAPAPIPAPSPQPLPQDDATGGAANQGDAFEDTGMGSGGGGGG